MAANVETLGSLERRLSMSVPIDEVERQFDERLKKLARGMKMSGFRPGKVPLKLVAQQYGPQVRSEVIGDALQKRFSDAVKEANLKVAGNPRIEPVTKEGEAAGDDKAFEFNATFEVYPEVKTGDLGAATIERPTVTVGEAEIDKTLEILRKQRTTFAAAPGRAAQKGDKLTIDFEGKINGETFTGGSAKGFAFVLGEGRMLPEFEAAAEGLKAGESKTFEMKFPDDYHGKDVAGKTAGFEIKVNQVEAASLPALDAEFAKALGVADGDLAKMRGDIKSNVEREVAKRVKSRTKAQALEALHKSTPIELPKGAGGNGNAEHGPAGAPGSRVARAQDRADAVRALGVRNRGEAPRRARPHHRRAGQERGPAAQARPDQEAHRGAGAILREPRRGGKMVLHAAATPD